MIKKFGAVAVGVTAGLVALAPFASAEAHAATSQKCSSSNPGANGSTNNFGKCSNFGKNSGQNNTFTFNGVKLPFPSAPTVPIQDVPIN